MKTKRPLTLVAGIVLIGAVGTGMYQGRQLAVRRGELQRLGQRQIALTRQIRQLTGQRDEATNLLAAVNLENARLRCSQELTELLRLRGQVGMLRQELTTVGRGMSPALLALAARDPAVKNHMREDIRRSVQLGWAGLLKELMLTPQQAEDVLQAFADAELKRFENLAAVGPGTLSQKELSQIEDNALGDFYQQLQTILGENGTARIKDALEENPGGVTIDSLNLQLGSSPLTEEQAKRLVGVVKAEPFHLTRGLVPGWDAAFWGTPRDIQDHVSKIEQSNQRILQAANGFLSPEQLSALSLVLSNSINAQLAYAAAYIQNRPPL